ncbi:hypothetical protein DSECCO2_635350 [anaerobic digester metagenome]
MHVANCQFLRQILQLAPAVFYAFRAVIGMIGQDDFQGFPTQIQQFLAGSLDLHTLFTRSGTGAHCFTIYFHHANPTIAKGRKIFMVTEVRNSVSRFGAGVQHLGIPQHACGFAIDIYSYHSLSQRVYSCLPFSTSLDIMSSLAFQIQLILVGNAWQKKTCPK